MAFAGREQKAQFSRDFRGKPQITQLDPNPTPTQPNRYTTRPQHNSSDLNQVVKSYLYEAIYGMMKLLQNELDFIN